MFALIHGTLLRFQSSEKTRIYLVIFFLSDEGMPRALGVMYYVYILLCSDGKLYVGSTKDFKDRMARHRRGDVRYTRSRLPVVLKSVIAVPDQYIALRLEDYLKTGSGRAFTLKHLLN